MAVEILHAVNEFYTLQVVDSLKRVEIFKKSHERWLQDFTRYYERYNSKLAQAIFDYTVLAVAGEMRHGGGQSELYNPYVPNGGRRSASMSFAKDYTPTSVLRAGKTLFEDGQWGSDSFGGEPWARIAEAGLLRSRLSDVAFIDYCIDLSHNSSPYFDKGEAGIFVLWSSHSYTNFLDAKRYDTPEYMVETRQLMAGPILHHLVFRATNLGIVPDYFGALVNNYEFRSGIDYILNYEPISWGTEELPDELEPCPREDDDDYDDWEEKDYDEETEEEEEDEEAEESYQAVFEYDTFDGADGRS